MKYKLLMHPRITFERWTFVLFSSRSRFSVTLRTKEDTTRKRRSVVPFAENDRAVVPVVISLRRTIRGNRTWEEEARITFSVIFRSTPRARYISQRVLKHSPGVFALARVSRCLFHLATLPEVLLFFLSPFPSLCHPLSVLWEREGESKENDPK